MTNRPATFRWVGLVLLVSFVAGCTSLRSTPEQEQAFDRFKACREAGAGVQLAEARTDGSLTLIGYHSQMALVTRCLAERYGYAPFGDPRIRQIILDPAGS